MINQNKNPIRVAPESVTLDTNWSTPIAIPLRGLLHGSTDFQYRPGEISSIYLKLDNISTAASVTIRTCADVTGDFAIIPEATGTIYAGISTATKGSVCFHGSEYKAAFEADASGYWYFTAKVNAGTADLTDVVFTVTL